MKREGWPPSVAEEVKADLEFHLEMVAQELISQGVPAAEARARAREQFADFPETMEECRAIARGRERDRRRSEWYRGIVQDVRGALRQLRRNPAFSAIAIGMIALGVGSTSGIFSVVNGVILTPLSFPDPEALVFICESNRGPDFCHTASPPNSIDLSRDANSISEIGLARRWSVIMSADGSSRGVDGGLATPRYFNVLQTTPALGRLFVEEDQNGVGSPVAVVSYEFWRTAFGADSAAVGRVVDIDGRASTIVGVLPEGFKAPFLAGIELWRPLHIDPADEEHRDWRGFRALARLTPGATVDDARLELSNRAEQLANLFPEANRGWTTDVRPLREQIVGSAGSTLMIFFGAVGFVLLIACANVANLLLARAADRRREMAVRAAIGAGTGRLLRLVLIESLLLAVLGGVGGLLVAVWSTDMFLRLAPPGIPRLDNVGLDGSVFLFAMSVTLATSLLFGLAPGWQALRLDLNEAVKQSSTPRARGKRHGGARSSLVIAEIAVAVVLLVGAGLLTRSFTRLLSWEPGFERDHLLTVWTFVSPGIYPERDRLPEFYDLAVAELGSLPGVEAVAMASAGPMFGGRETGEVIAQGSALPPGERPTVRWYDVDRHYFSTMGIPLVRGRPFGQGDRGGAPRVALINETAARTLFGTDDPIGRRITMTLHQMTLEVVGVVADVPPIEPDRAVDPEVYWPFAQVPRWASYIVIRSNGDPTLQSKAVTDRLTALEPTIKLSTPETMPELIDHQLTEPRFAMLLVGAFSLIALVLAGGGVYGVLAYAVARRTREIGIRMALGANRGRVVWLVIRQGLGPAMAGAAIGVVGSLVLSRIIAGMLHGVSPTDSATIGLVATLMVTVGLFSSWLPARRATRIDPTRALRSE